MADYSRCRDVRGQVTLLKGEVVVLSPQGASTAPTIQSVAATFAGVGPSFEGQLRSTRRTNVSKWYEGLTTLTIVLLRPARDPPVAQARQKPVALSRGISQLARSWSLMQDLPSSSSPT
jgi:hypothetical protein